MRLPSLKPTSSMPAATSVAHASVTRAPGRHDTFLVNDGTKAEVIKRPSSLQGKDGIVPFPRKARAHHVADQAAGTVSKVTSAINEPANATTQIYMASLPATAVTWAASRAAAVVHPQAGEGVRSFGQQATRAMVWPQQWLAATSPAEAGTQLGRLAEDVSGRVKLHAQELGWEGKHRQSRMLAKAHEATTITGAHVASVATEGWQAVVPQGLRDRVRGGLHQQSMMSLTQRAAAVGASTTTALHTASAFMHELEGLRQMVADHTGKPEAKTSIFDALFARDLPPFLARYRNNLRDNMGPAALITAANYFVTWKMASSDLSFIPGMQQVQSGRGGAIMGLAALPLITMVPWVTDTLGKHVTPSNPAPRLYHALSEDYQQNKHLSHELAADFLMHATASFPNLRRSRQSFQEVSEKGGPESLTQAAQLEYALLGGLAGRYAQQGYGPAQLLAKVSSGEVVADALALRQQLVSQQREGGAAPTPAPGEAVLPGGENHGRLQAPALQLEGRE